MEVRKEAAAGQHAGDVGGGVAHDGQHGHAVKLRLGLAEALEDVHGAVHGEPARSQKPISCTLSLISKKSDGEPSSDAQRIAGQTVAVERAEDGHQREVGARDPRDSEVEEPEAVLVEAHVEVAVAAEVVPVEAHVEVAVAVVVVGPVEVEAPQDVVKLRLDLAVGARIPGTAKSRNPQLSW